MFAPIVASLLNSFPFLSVWQSSLSSSWSSSIFDDIEQLFLFSRVVIMMLHILNAKYKITDGGLANVKKRSSMYLQNKFATVTEVFEQIWNVSFFCPPLLATAINCVCASISYPLCRQYIYVTYIEDVRGSPKHLFNV